MKIDGKCHCGQVTYTADVDPDTARICHCVDCQIFAGGPYSANVAVKTGTFQLTRGALKHYIKTADSGNQRAHGLCENCGTRLYSASVTGEPRQYTLRVGPITQRARITPKSQIWCDSAMPWAMDVKNLPSRPRQ